jgi:NADH dehydrogenase
MALRSGHRPSCCTIGATQNRCRSIADLLLDAARIMVNDDLSVPRMRAWAVGDCARIRNMLGAQSLRRPRNRGSRSAVPCRNLLATIRGAPPSRFGSRQRGSMAAIGHRRVSQRSSECPCGLAAWLLWRAYYLSQMPTSHASCASSSSVWAALFRTDITPSAIPHRTVESAREPGINVLPTPAVRAAPAGRCESHPLGVVSLP